MEYILTNLPQYVRITPRSDFSSSVVSSGAVLLFSEDGYTLTGKLPDGTFITIGGSSGADPVGDATAGDLLAGKSATISGGSVISGTIPTVSASLVSSQVVVPAGYIAASQTFNVSGGVDVSDTTAQAADVLSGKVFYNSGGIQTYGTIPTVTATLAANVTTVPSGYIASAQELTVPLASSATVAGGIVTIPAGYVASDYTVSVGGGGSTDYFKCATVTSGGSTWTGYKAVLSAGSYSFESAASSGLTYGSGFTPQVGKIYTDGALVQVTKLYSGLDPSLVFYAPLNGSPNTETGQTLTTTGTVTFTTEDGIPCAYFDGNAKFSFEMESLLTTLSFSAWFKYGGGSDSNLIALGTPDSMNNMACIYLNVNGGNVGWSSWGDDQFYPCSTGEWHHIAILADSSDGSVSIYIDGTSVGTSYHFWELISENGWLGGNGLESYNFTGYLASARIYDRLLTPAEIAELAAEFTPSVS